MSETPRAGSCVKSRLPERMGRLRPRNVPAARSEPVLRELHANLILLVKTRIVKKYRRHFGGIRSFHLHRIIVKRNRLAVNGRLR